MVADVAGAFCHRGPGGLVLLGQTRLAGRPDFYLSALADRHRAAACIRAARRDARGGGWAVVVARQRATPGVYRGDLFRRVALSGARILQRLLFSVFFRGRSFSIPRKHGAVGLGGGGTDGGTGAHEPGQRPGRRLGLQSEGHRAGGSTRGAGGDDVARERALFEQGSAVAHHARAQSRSLHGVGKSW